MNIAVNLCEKENGDELIVGISAFMHDIHRIMQNETGKFVSPKDSLSKVKEILGNTDLSRDIIEKICYCIEFHENYNWNGNNVEDIIYHSETGEKMVAYRALYGDNKLWARPYDMFLDEVNKNGQQYRFELQDIKSVQD